jgi:hypothetical protein
VPRLLANLSRLSPGPSVAASASPRRDFDAWTHEQDVRATLRQRGVRENERVQWLAGQMRAMLSKRFEAAGTPALRVGGAVLSVGAPGGMLAVTDYELLRIIFGRRSEGTDPRLRLGPGTHYRTWTIHLFPPPSADLVD